MKKSKVKQQDDEFFDMNLQLLDVQKNLEKVKDPDNPDNKVDIIQKLLLTKLEKQDNKPDELMERLREQSENVNTLVEHINKLQEHNTMNKPGKYLKSKIDKLEATLFKKNKSTKKIDDMIELFMYNLESRMLTLMVKTPTNKGKEMLPSLPSHMIYNRPSFVPGRPTMNHYKSPHGYRTTGQSSILQPHSNSQSISPGFPFRNDESHVQYLNRNSNNIGIGRNHAYEGIASTMPQYYPGHLNGNIIPPIPFPKPPPNQLYNPGGPMTNLPKINLHHPSYFAQQPLNTQNNNRHIPSVAKNPNNHTNVPSKKSSYYPQPYNESQNDGKNPHINLPSILNPKPRFKKSKSSITMNHQQILQSEVYDKYGKYTNKEDKKDKWKSPEEISLANIKKK